jgi:hypothetical protein
MQIGRRTATSGDSIDPRPLPFYACRCWIIVCCSSRSAHQFKERTMLKAFKRFSLFTMALMAVLLVTVNLDADQEKLQPDMKLVSKALAPLLKNLDPKPVMEISNHGHTINIQFRPQTFKIHGKSKSGEIAAEAHDEVGPSFKGFVLNIHLQPKGEINQAVTPQTVQRPYWLMDLEITELAKTDHQIYWALSYGSQTPKDVLKEIREKLSALAE